MKSYKESNGLSVQNCNDVLNQNTIRTKSHVPTKDESWSCDLNKVNNQNPHGRWKPIEICKNCSHLQICPKQFPFSKILSSHQHFENAQQCSLLTPINVQIKKPENLQKKDSLKNWPNRHTGIKDSLDVENSKKRNWMSIILQPDSFGRSPFLFGTGACCELYSGSRWQVFWHCGYRKKPNSNFASATAEDNEAFILLNITRSDSRLAKPETNRKALINHIVACSSQTQERPSHLRSHCQYIEPKKISPVDLYTRPKRKLMVIGLCVARLRLRCTRDCFHYSKEVLAQIRSSLVLNCHHSAAILGGQRLGTEASFPWRWLTIDHIGAWLFHTLSPSQTLLAFEVFHAGRWVFISA